MHGYLQLKQIIKIIWGVQNYFRGRVNENGIEHNETWYNEHLQLRKYLEFKVKNVTFNLTIGFMLNTKQATHPWFSESPSMDRVV